MPPLPAKRPGQPTTLGDHEARIRALERLVAPPDIDTESELNHRGWPTYFDLPFAAKTGWTYEIDPAVPFNRKLVHSGPGPDPLIWMLSLHPGGWTPLFTMKIGPAMGELSMSVAGAYDFQTLDLYPAVPVSPDWIFVGSNDFSLSSADEYVVNQYLGQEVFGVGPSSFTGASAWQVPKDVDQYALSTMITGTLLDGSSGYYFFKIECDGAAEIAQIVIVDDGQAEFGGRSIL